jgi:hypothetical protein
MTLNPGDKVNHRDPRVAWTEAEVISTPEINRWDCVPGVIRVRRYPGDPSVTIPTRLLKLAEPEF